MIQSRRILLAFLPLLSALVTAPAAAQNVAAAEALFNKGLEDMNAGRFKSGCAAIGESYKLDPLPGALFTLAECHAEAGNIATAVARYEEYLRAFASLTPSQQAKQRAQGRNKRAAAQKAELSPKVPELTLTLPASAPKGTRVVQDDVALGSAALGIALPIDPGDHVVTTQAPGGPVTENRFTIAVGEKKQLELRVQVQAPAADGAVSGTSGPRPSTGGSGAYRGAMIAAWGVGAAGIAVGLVTGGLALGKQDSIKKDCAPQPVNGKVECGPEGLDAAHSAQSLELASTIGFAVGLTGLAAGAVLLILQPKDPPRSGSMRWLSVGVASTGGGAAALVKGAW